MKKIAGNYRKNGSGNTCMTGRRRYAALIGAVLMICLFVGCGARSESLNMKSDSYDGGMYTQATMAMTTSAVLESGWASDELADMEWSKSEPTATAGGATQTSSGNGLNDSARKLIRDASITVETLEYEIFLERIEAEITNLGGYIETYTNNDKSYYSGRYSRHAYITARIPQQYFDVFLNTVGDLGNVTNESQNATDITMSYVDVESRKKALEIEQERLLALLEKANKIEDIIALEERLSNVRYQLESYSSQLRTYDNLVNYSTVRLNIEEVIEITKEEPQTLLERMSRGFSDTISDIVEGAKDFAVWFVTNAIYLVFWAIIIIVIVVLIARLFKKLFRKLEQLAKKTTAPSQNESSEKSEKSEKEEK